MTDKQKSTIPSNMEDAYRHAVLSAGMQTFMKSQCMSGDLLALMQNLELLKNFTTEAHNKILMLYLSANKEAEQSGKSLVEIISENEELTIFDVISKDIYEISEMISKIREFNNTIEENYQTILREVKEHPAAFEVMKVNQKATDDFLRDEE